MGIEFGMEKCALLIRSREGESAGGTELPVQKYIRTLVEKGNYWASTITRLNRWKGFYFWSADCSTHLDVTSDSTVDPLIGPRCVFDPDSWSIPCQSSVDETTQLRK